MSVPELEVEHSVGALKEEGGFACLSQSLINICLMVEKWKRDRKEAVLGG